MNRPFVFCDEPQCGPWVTLDLRSPLLLLRLAVIMKWFVAVLMYLCVGRAVIADEPIDAVEVLNRIISRAEQLQTGVFEFSVTTKTLSSPLNAPELRVIVQNKGTEFELRSLGFLKPPQGKQFPNYQLLALTVSDEFGQFRRVSVAGDDWVAHCQAVPSTEIGRGDFAATYTERKPDSGETQRNLLIEPSYEGLTQSTDGLIWRQFLQCGTIPKLLLDFFSSSRPPDGARRVDGIIELEWQLKQRELQQIFGKTVPAYLYQGEHCFLVMKTNPSDGYVLPEIHFQSQDRFNQVSFVSTNFKDAGNGIFFPLRWEYVCVSPFNMEHISFDFLSASGVNEPLPPDVFELKLVDGTRVRNTLAGHEAVFTIGQASNAKSISECLAYVPEEQSRGVSVTRRVIVLIGSIGIGVLLLWLILKQTFLGRQTPAV
ncbi:MAG: hypothetical protein WCO86_13185 [Planctomycetota bacterium]